MAVRVTVSPLQADAPVAVGASGVVDSVTVTEAVLSQPFKEAVAE